MGERANKLKAALLKHGLWLPFQIALVEMLAIAGAILTEWITGKALFQCLALVWIVIWFGFGSRSWAALRSAYCAFAMAVFIALVAQYNNVSLIDVLIAGSVFYIAADAAFFSYGAPEPEKLGQAERVRHHWIWTALRAFALVSFPFYVFLFEWGFAGDIGEIMSAAYPIGSVLVATLLIMIVIEFRRDKRKGTFADPWVWLKYAYIVVLLGNAFIWAFTRIRY